MKLGSSIGSGRQNRNRISFAMFADDTTLIARSRRSLEKMLHHIQIDLAKIGLNLNIAKCSVQCSKPTARINAGLMVDGQSFPIVSRDAGFKILGTTFTLNGNNKLEFEQRLRAGYGKFHELWPLFGKRDSCLKRRLRLFQATVSQTVLWCADSWTLTVAQKRHLRAVQRNLLRRFAGPKRRPDEDYLTWIRRATKESDKNAREGGVECWLKQFLRRKFSWAGKVTQMTEERLAKRVTTWRDSDWWHDQPRGSSSYGARPLRPNPGSFLRWEDDLRRFAESKQWENWQTKAKTMEWEDFAEEFVAWAWR